MLSFIIPAQCWGLGIVLSLAKRIYVHETAGVYTFIQSYFSKVSKLFYLLVEWLTFDQYLKMQFFKVHS